MHKFSKTAPRTVFVLPLEKILQYSNYETYLALTTTCSLMLNKSMRDEGLKKIGISLSRKHIGVDLQWETRTEQCKVEHEWMTRMRNKLVVPAASKNSSHDRKIIAEVKLASENKTWKNISKNIFTMGMFVICFFA
jgi:hypothetical protein